MPVRDDDALRRIADLRGHDAYVLLGLPRSARAAAITPAYRRAMARVHPDRGGSAEEAQLINCAHEVLHRHRDAYDAHLAAEARAATGDDLDDLDGDEFFADLFAARERQRARDRAPGDPAGHSPPRVVHVTPTRGASETDPGPGRLRRPGPPSRGLLLTGLVVVVVAGVLLAVHQSRGAGPGTAAQVAAAPTAAAAGSASGGSWTRTSMTPAISATTAGAVTADLPAPDETTVSAAGADPRACVVRNDASLWCTGGNEHGQAGDGSTRRADGWVRAGDAGVRWVAVALDAATTCGITADGALWCWGDNASGQVGDGTTSARARPTRVLPGTTWRSVAVSGHVCAIRADETLWCWGPGASGELGRGPMTGTATPLQVGDATGWVSVQVSPGRTCARNADGGGQCWGAA